MCTLCKTSVKTKLTCVIQIFEIIFKNNGEQRVKTFLILMANFLNKIQHDFK